MPDIAEKLKLICGGELLYNELLAKYTTFKIGGPAKYFCRCSDQDELMKLIKMAEKKNLPYFLLGGGSNVLVSDEGFDGLVINLVNNRIKVVGNIIYCDGGVLLSKLVGQTLSSSLSGLEWAAGIPGMVGGAVRGNAGAYGGEMKDNIAEVSIIRKGKVRTIKNKDCKFGYRDSVFKNNSDTIWSVKFELEKSDQEAIKRKMKEISSKRKKKFNQYDCAGCVFKNVELDKDKLINFKNKFPQLPEEYIRYSKIPAAWLIDQCGLRGRQVGGAKILDDHAAIIINVDDAKAKDVARLISLIKQEVKGKFGIELEEEIEYLGF